MMPLPTQARLNQHLIRWDSVLGYEGRYEVSDDGRVRSLPNRTRTGVRELAQSRVSGGYLAVCLFKDGVKRMELVHRLVPAAFCGVPSPGDEVCHGNGTRDDNRATNLRWDSRSANQKDSIAHGTHAMSSRTSCAKGHLFTQENTYARPNGSRYCRECHRESARRAA